MKLIIYLFIYLYLYLQMYNMIMYRKYIQKKNNISNKFSTFFKKSIPATIDHLRNSI